MLDASNQLEQTVRFSIEYDIRPLSHENYEYVIDAFKHARFGTLSAGILSKIANVLRLTVNYAVIYFVIFFKAEERRGVNIFARQSDECEIIIIFI